MMVVKVKYYGQWKILAQVCNNICKFSQFHNVSCKKNCHYSHLSYSS